MSNKFKIIDSHSHYDDESFNEDRDEVLSQIKANGVIGILNCASSYESLRDTDELTRKYDYIHGALGIQSYSLVTPLSLSPSFKYLLVIF